MIQTLKVSSLEDLRNAFVDWLEKQAERDRDYGKNACYLKRDQNRQFNFALALENAASVWKDVIIILEKKSQ